MEFVIDLAICLTLTLTGGIVGMDKVHDIRDYVGPLIIFAALVYALWKSMFIIASFVAAAFLLKILIR